MQKSADAFRTIGEMAEELNVRTHILRYWEEQFPTLQPLKRAGGRRLYRPDDVALLKTIHKLLNHEGYTIKGARKFLGSGGSGIAPTHLSPTTTSELDFNSLRAVRDRLGAALAAA